MVEYCYKAFEMLDIDRFIEETPGRTTVPTFLTDGFEDVDMMCFPVEGDVGREQLEARGRV